jgi:hypothetical protein
MANGPDALEHGDPTRGRTDDMTRTSRTSIRTTPELHRQLEQDGQSPWRLGTSEGGKTEMTVALR